VSPEAPPEITGRLDVVPALTRPDLLAAPVAETLRALPPGVAERALVAEIDPDHADTATLVELYGVSAAASGNCVLVGGRRDGAQRVAACVVPATARADVNGLVRRRLDVRKASFLAMDQAVSGSGMEYGGITAIGLPASWPVLLDATLAELPAVVIGSGLRRSKLVVPGALLAALPGAEVVPGLGRPAG
jgi:prolyl-tRNA editing enzyme YbaK/EbsC (Cys-tRNA(Pro) deacylase)